MPDTIPLPAKGKGVKVEEEKPQSRRVFGLGIQEIVRATARVYGKRVEELGNKRRGNDNEAQAMAMYLCRSLGGYKLTEIGKVLGLEKYSSVSSACLAMKGRIDKEKRPARQVEKLLLKGQQQPSNGCPPSRFRLHELVLHVLE